MSWSQLHILMTFYAASRCVPFFSCAFPCAFYYKRIWQFQSLSEFLLLWKYSCNECALNQCVLTYLCIVLCIVDSGHLWSVWTTCLWQWETGKGLSRICRFREAYCWRIWMLATAWQDTSRLAARTAANTADNEEAQLRDAGCWYSWRRCGRRI